jgi:Zn-dependent peptidase ImmA (M78 family)/DNA-binding XRE family transcriptional regulator
MSQFTPSRLQLARKRRGMTKTALAKETGLSVRIIKAYEAGDSQPQALSLARLAKALDFPESFFRLKSVEGPQVTGSSFRALSRMTAAKRDQALGAGALAIDLAEWIDEHFHLPEPDVPRYRGVDPETAAEAVRNEWGLGERKIKNMIHLLEAHGIRVFSLVEETRDLDAFSEWHDGRTPFIFLNTMKSSEHSRMDAAHELGHLVMHSRHTMPSGREQEREAQQFGAAFLMPQSSVVANAPRSGRLKDLIRAKRQWDVALANLAYRMRALDLMTEWQFKSVMIELSSRGYRTHEPHGIPRETSQVLAKVLQSLREEGVTPGHVARELGIYPSELQRLLFGLVLTPIESSEGDLESSDTVRPNLQVVDG